MFQSLKLKLVYWLVGDTIHQLVVNAALEAHWRLNRVEQLTHDMTTHMAEVHIALTSGEYTPGLINGGFGGSSGPVYKIPVTKEKT